MENIDYARLLKVAATGAITAVIADFAYTNYGSEMRALVEQALDLINQANTPQQPGPVGG